MTHWDREAVTATHKVFDWSQTSLSGLLFFIIIADAILRKGTMESIREDMRAIVKTFLDRKFHSLD